MNKHIRWYLLALLLAALIVNENIVLWMLAVSIGGLSILEGLAEAFMFFTIIGFLFTTAFRAIPYIGLGIVLIILSKTKLNGFVLPVFLGGLIGILGMIIWGLWVSLRPFYTDEHMSSTTGLVFIFIPFWACITGGLGMLVFSIIYSPIWYWRRKKAKQTLQNTELPSTSSQ